MEKQTDWIDLTDEEIEACNRFTTDWGPGVWFYSDEFEEAGFHFARAIEAKLREKNARSNI